jgi:hypothetical protein
LVMDLLPGGGFDALAAQGWEVWQHQARALLESLARVHFAGVLHLDLKPGNVLLDDHGRPVITDFGLARGRSVHNPEDAPREGTPRYMAPEQHSGGEVTAATDLYAIGGIFWEMLVGRALPREPTDREMPVDCAPAMVRQTVLALLSEDPAARPQSAVEVLDTLFDAAAVLGPAELGLPAVATAEDLEPLFDEEQPTFLYLARDAAKVLHQITAGRRSAVRAELDRWVRAGLAWWNGARVHIERPAIEQLQWGLDPESRRLAGLAYSSPREAVAAALLAARMLRDDGFVGRAVAILEAAMPIARQLGGGAEVAEALVEALIDRPNELPAALHHAEREQAVAALAVGGAVRIQNDGQWAASAEALQLAIHTHTLKEPLRFTAFAAVGYAMRMSRDTEYEAWLQEPDVPFGVSSLGHGLRAYARGDYGASFEHHMQAANEGPWGFRVAALTNAAAAAIEIPDIAGSDAVLQRIDSALNGHFAPRLEVRRHWLRRQVAYRLGNAGLPQPEWVRAAAVVSQIFAAQIAQIEAAVGWRCDHESAPRMAALAMEGFLRIDRSAGAGLLCEALLCATTGAHPPRSILEYAAIRPVAVAVQALALLAPHVQGKIDTSPLLAQAMAERRGNVLGRLEVLSLDEVVDQLHRL